MSIKTLFSLAFSAYFLFLPLGLSAVGENGGDDPFVVVLDAGHGGHDPGNLGNGYLEKDIALKIVLQVGQILSEHPDIKVVYTRETDKFVDLFLRGQIANKADADLFVSVHCDSHTSDAHGAGTFVLGLHANKQNFEIAKKENSVIYLEDDYETRYADYDINSPESIIGLTIMQEEFLDQSIALAKLMQDNFTAKLHRVDRKVKQAGFIVLHQTFMPSVLVETGFLTNKEEGKYLDSKKGQTDMGKAIADAIIKYKNEVRHTSGSPEIVVAPSVEEPPAKDPEPKAPQTTTADVGVAQVPPTATGTSEPPKIIDAKPGTSVSLPDLGETAAPSKKPADAVKENGVVFMVQLMATSQDLPLDSGRFSGLGRMSKEPYKNMIRYLYGHTDSYDTALKLKENADRHGYPTSYIVAYKDGVRIPVPEALKYPAQ